MSRKIKLIVLLSAIELLILLFAVMLSPLELEVSPSLGIEAVDLQGKPVPGCQIEQRWAWWGVEHQFHRNLVTSDASGSAHFARRVTRATRLRMFLLRHLIAGVEGVPKYGPIVWLSTGYVIDQSPSDLARSFGKDSSGALKIPCVVPQTLHSR